jgi:putrescine---pyruvate transaminase
MSVKESVVQELMELDKKHFLHPTTVPKIHAEQGPKIIFEKGEGIYVMDVHGDKYIDGVSMLWNVNLGHGQVELAEAAKQQMEKLAYSSSFIGYSNEPAIKLAEKLATLAPGDLNAVFYTSGGSESNDSAIKLSRFYWELKGKPTKRKIIALENAYHGVTVASQTATSIPNFHSFANSNISEVLHAKPHLTNCELGDKQDPNYEGCIRDIIEKEGADSIAAVLMEPVQGAGGVYIPDEGYLQAVRKLCDENDILFIADEVICGFGRTGQMFGVQNWNVVPDFLCFAKGVTSGYSQLGGVLIRQEIRDVLVQYDGVLSHGFTYSGHATACSVGLKNIEIMERENVVLNAKNMETELLKGFEFLKSRHSIVTKTRAIGLLSAFELYEEPEADKPFDISVQAATKVAEECFKRKLLIRPIRVAEGRNIIAIAPPLVINKQQIEDIFFILDEAIAAFRKNL